MICKNCNKELSEGETVCPSCGASVETEKENFTPDMPKKKKRLRDKISNICGVIKNKLHITSIFDQSVPRTPLESKVSSKYFVLLICSFLLVFLWFSGSIKFSVPLSSFADEFDVEEIQMEDISVSLSMTQILGGVTMTKNLMESTSDLLIASGIELETFHIIMLIISVIIAIYKFATFAISISPIFLLLPLITRSVNKGVWLIFESLCLISSFVIHSFFFFLVIKLISMFINGVFKDAIGGISGEDLGLSGLINVRLNLYGYLFIAVYIISFIIIISILRDFSKNKEKKSALQIEALQ